MFYTFAPFLAGYPTHWETAATTTTTTTMEYIFETLPEMAREFIVAPIVHRYADTKGWIKNTVRNRGSKRDWCSVHFHGRKLLTRYVTHVYILLCIRLVSPRMERAIRHDAFWNYPPNVVSIIAEERELIVGTCLGESPCWTGLWLSIVFGMYADRVNSGYVAFMRQLLKAAKTIEKEARGKDDMGVQGYLACPIEELEDVALSYKQTLDSILGEQGGEAKAVVSRRLYKHEVWDLPPEDYVLLKTMWPRMGPMLSAIRREKRYRTARRLRDAGLAELEKGAASDDSEEEAVPPPPEKKHKTQ